MRAAFLFDLDGTLIDSVYQHVLAWREALEQGGIRLSVWRIHRRIGMSGGLFVNALLRETGRNITGEEAERLQGLHAAAYARMASQVRPLPGAEQLLAHLSQTQVPYAIATSGRPESAGPALKALNVPPEVPVVPPEVPAASRRRTTAGTSVADASPLRDRHQRAAGERRPRAESPERPAGSSGRHARSGAAREAGSGPVPGRGRAAGGVHSRLDRGRRQHLGPACRAARPSDRCRTAFRRLWPGGVGEGRSLSRLSGPSRPADALGRTRHPPGGLIMRDAASGGTSSLSPGYRNPAYRTIGGDGCGWYPGTAIRIRRRRIAPTWTARRK